MTSFNTYLPSSLQSLVETETLMKQINDLVAHNHVLEHKKSLLETTMLQDQRECQLLQQQLHDIREQYTALTSWKSSSIQTIADLEKQVTINLMLRISPRAVIEHAFQHPHHILTFPYTKSSQHNLSSPPTLCPQHSPHSISQHTLSLGPSGPRADLVTDRQSPRLPENHHRMGTAGEPPWSILYINPMY